MYWSACKELIKLSVPLIVSQVGLFIVQLTDTLMVGSVSATDLAAVAFGSNVYFFIYIFGIGLVSGMVPVIGEVYAKNSLLKRYFYNSLFLYGVIGIVFAVMQFSLIFVFPYLGQPIEIIDISQEYYIYLVLSTVPLMIFCVFRYFLEGIGNTKIVMKVIVYSNIINIGLNYVLIYGKLGFPAMGACGAGLSTLVARILMVIFMILYYCNSEYRRILFGFSKDILNSKYVIKLLSVGCPIAIQMTLEGGAFAITGIIIGVFGKDVLAANQVAIVIGNVSFLIISAISTAVTIKISHYYGHNDWTEIRVISNVSYKIIIVINILTIVILYVFRSELVGLFTDDNKVSVIVKGFILYLCLYQISDGIQGIAVGILRGIQDVKIIPIIAFFSYFIVNIPCGCLLAFILKMGYNGLWYGYIMGLSIAAIYFYIRVKVKIKMLV